MGEGAWTSGSGPGSCKVTMNAPAKLSKPTPSDLAIPPGKYLEEVIGELGMTKDELATRMARPATKLSQIFKGSLVLLSISPYSRNPS